MTNQPSMFPAWQPIDTAPKNGETILTLTIMAGTPVISATSWDDEGDWHTVVDLRGLLGFLSPQYWMPMPPPPEGKEYYWS